MNDALMNYFQQFIEDIRTNTQDPGDLSGRIVITIAIVLAWVFLKRIAATFWYWAVKKKKTAARLTATTRFILGFITVLVSVRVWLSVDDSILILLILAGGLIVVSGRELLTNVIGWVFIITHRPFRAGDRIEIDGSVGQVLRIDWQTFSLIELANWFDSESPTGRIRKIPNHLILEATVTNYSDTSHFVWKELRYQLTYASDWEAAYAIIKTAVDRYLDELKTSLNDHDMAELKKQQFVTGGNLETVMIVDADETGVAIKARYPVRYEVNTAIRTELQKEILKAFKARPDIEPIGEYLHVHNLLTRAEGKHLD